MVENDPTKTGVSFDKKNLFARAQTLIKKKDDFSLFYACLELRFCLEKIAYEKLMLLRSRIPSDLWKIWQPPQLFKALLELEPDLEANQTLAVRETDASGNPKGGLRSVGTRYSFSHSWLNKTYHSLGSFLHLPKPSADSKNRDRNARVSKVRQKLVDILNTLEPIVQNTFDHGFAPTEVFGCVACGRRIIKNRDSLATNPTAECFHPECQMQYRVEKNGDDYELSPLNSVECQKCNSIIPISEKKVREGSEFACRNCHEVHIICKKVWHYVTKKIWDEHPSKKG